MQELKDKVSENKNGLAMLEQKFDLTIPHINEKLDSILKVVEAYPEKFVSKDTCTAHEDRFVKLETALEIHLTNHNADIKEKNNKYTGLVWGALSVIINTFVVLLATGKI